jgi:hypothetical protein
MMETAERVEVRPGEVTRMDQLVKSLRSSVGVLAVLAVCGVGSVARADKMENNAKTTPHQRAEKQTA